MRSLNFACMCGVGLSLHPFFCAQYRVAEGLTIQVFFKAWEQLDRFHMVSTFFLSWLYTIAHVRAMEHHRTHKLQPASDNPITLAARGDEFREEFQIICDGLRILTNEKQNVLILKHVIGMPDKDIAYRNRNRSTRSLRTSLKPA